MPASWTRLTWPDSNAASLKLVMATPGRLASSKRLELVDRVLEVGPTGRTDRSELGLLGCVLRARSQQRGCRPSLGPDVTVIDFRSFAVRPVGSALARRGFYMHWRAGAYQEIPLRLQARSGTQPPAAETLWVSPRSNKEHQP